MRQEPFGMCLIQMFLMCMVEIFYLNFYTRVKFHREVFKFKDGGQSALDWGFEMPQKTKYLTRSQK